MTYCNRFYFALTYIHTYIHLRKKFLEFTGKKLFKTLKILGTLYLNIHFLETNYNLLEIFKF